MDAAHKVLGSGSEHGPVVDLGEPEDPCSQIDEGVPTTSRVG